MIRSADAFTALYGAARLARFDKAGLGYFDVSLRGFWNSFYAGVIVAPLYAVLVALRTTDADAGWAPLVIDALAYVVNWLVFPVVMLTLVRMLDRQRFYLRHIVAYNWASAVQNFVYLPLALLIQAGLLPTDVGALLSLLALGWVVVYSSFVTHVALDVPVPTAAALVVVDLVLGIVVNGLAGGGGAG